MCAGGAQFRRGARQRDANLRGVLFVELKLPLASGGRDTVQYQYHTRISDNYTIMHIC